MTAPNQVMDTVMRRVVQLRMRRGATYPVGRTALVVVAPQPDLLAGGAPDLAALVHVARAACVHVVLAPVARPRPGRVLTPSQQALLERQLLVPGTPGAGLDPALEVSPGDVVLAPFEGLSAFSNPGLGAELTARRCDHVIVAGARTEIEVDSTARDATESALHTTVVADCCVGSTATGHDAAVVTTLPRLVQAVTSLADLRRVLADPGR